MLAGRTGTECRRRAGRPHRERRHSKQGRLGLIFAVWRLQAMLVSCRSDQDKIKVHTYLLVS